VSRLIPLAAAFVLAAGPAGSQPLGPALTVPDRIPAAAGGGVSVPVQFVGNGHSIAATAFSVDFDAGCLDFDPTDANGDAVPDAVSLGLPPGFGASVTFDAGDADGELDLFVADTLPPLASLPDGPVAAVAFTASCQPPPGGRLLADVGFSADPEASFGDTSGSAVPGTADSGSVEIGPAATPTPSGPRPRLSLAQEVAAFAGGSAEVPLSFTASGHSIAATAFSVNYDQACLSFDPADANGDTVPDAVDLSLPPGFGASVTFDAGDTDGELDFLVADTLPPLSVLTDGILARITFGAACEPGLGNTLLVTAGFSEAPAASFGDAQGRGVSGLTVDGSIRISSGVTPSPTPTRTATGTRTRTATGTLTRTVTATRTPEPAAAPVGSAAWPALVLLFAAVFARPSRYRTVGEPAPQGVARKPEQTLVRHSSLIAHRSAAESARAPRGRSDRSPGLAAARIPPLN
jgi:hypothetical protein